MVNQQVFLPMIPDSAPIVVNISQYDYDAAGYAGRLFFNLVNEGAAYDMDGASAIFQGEKPDGTTFAYNATVVNASVVRVNVRQQMTTAAGRVICQLVLSNNDGQIGSFNIWLEVQPSSASGGDPSQTDIPALIAQAQHYAEVAEQAANSTAAWAANPPYIGANGNWFVYDTTTSSYADTGVYAAGTEGNLWYAGTAVSGKDPTPTVYPTGISTARVGDMYLNKTEGAIYQCTLGGNDTVAKWAFVMTLTGGGGGGTSDYPDLTNKPQINGTTLVGNKTTGDLIPLGDGLKFDPITLKLSTDLLAGSNVSLVPQADGAILISATGGGGGGGSTVSWTQIQTATGATKIAEIDIDGNTTDVYAPSGGGGPSYNMVDNDAYITEMQTKALDDTDDTVASAYAIANWANLDAILLKATVNQGDTGLGNWNDTWETDGDRQGWMWHECLFRSVLDENGNPVYDIELEVVNDNSKSEVVSLYAYRIDDEVYVAVTPSGTENPHDEGWYESDGATPPVYTLTSDTTVQAGKTYYKGGGAIALKFNGSIQSTTLDVCVKVIYQRTKVVAATILT